MTASFLGKLPGNSRADLPGKFQDAVSMLLLFPNSYGLPGPLCKHREKGQFTTGQSFTVCSQLRNRKWEGKREGLDFLLHTERGFVFHYNSSGRKWKRMWEAVPLCMGQEVKKLKKSPFLSGRPCLTLTSLDLLQRVVRAICWVYAFNEHSAWSRGAAWLQIPYYKEIVYLVNFRLNFRPSTIFQCREGLVQPVTDAAPSPSSQVK